MTNEKTNEKEPAGETSQNATKEALVSVEKPVVTGTGPSIDINGPDDQNRRVVIFASILLIALATPVFLPVQGERSLWQMMRYDSTGRVLIGAILGWPVCLGVIGILRGLRKNVPGRALIAIATTITAIQSLAGLALVVMLLAFERRAVDSPFVWLGAASTVAAVGLVVRSFFRTEWQRWQHLMAPIALLAMMIVFMIAGVERNTIERVSEGGWGFLFATAALVPFAGRTFLLRRG